MYPIWQVGERDKNASDSIVIFICVTYKEKIIFYKAIVIIDLHRKGFNYLRM